MITFQDVKKSYGSYIFDVSSLHIPQGIITGLVGKNGAGKTTAIKMMLGLVKPEGGEVKVLGTDARHLSAQKKQEIGVVLSESGFSSYLNISDIEHILMKMYPEFDRDYFKQKCKEFHLPEGKKIAEFSTGMKVKLKVLIAITHKAKLLILDEPTTGLDVEAREAILDILREYMTKQEPCSILITSHISSDLENLCDDIYMINDGKIILHEDMYKLLDLYGVIKANEEQAMKKGIEQGIEQGIERGRIETLYTDCNMSVSDIAKKVSKSEDYVKEIIKKISAACL